jgi:hypothetical protein
MSEVIRMPINLKVAARPRPAPGHAVRLYQFPEQPVAMARAEPRAAGQAAAEACLPLSACPYPDRTRDAVQWRIGWTSVALRRQRVEDWRAFAERTLEMLDECREALVEIRDRAPPDIRAIAVRALPLGCA